MDPAKGDSRDHADVIAIVGAGEMGSAVGWRMRLNGARVLTSLLGRSAASEDRVHRAGLELVDDDSALIRDADFILSIVPPAAAISVAARLRSKIASASSKPVFVECNAVSPATVRHIEGLLASTGCPFIDAGIIGGPPSPSGQDGPRFYASGPNAHLMARLGRYGLDIAVIDGPVGAASGLKLCYAGLTKGFIALGSAMISAAARDGLASALRDELARSQPAMLGRLQRQITAMFPKAHRWVAEMEQIAEFLGDAGNGAEIYAGIARLYAALAKEIEAGDSARLDALKSFCEASMPPRSGELE
jgi:3-hydroxyisobutyrate dehydrogenase-like beta-hydroxyacid dehydrogenase